MDEGRLVNEEVQSFMKEEVRTAKKMKSRKTVSPDDQLSDYSTQSWRVRRCLGNGDFQEQG